MPWSEGEGKSCGASVHLCSPGLACDPFLKICRRLISVGGSCTEQNAFMCESGICGYAATQTVEGEPLGGRHSLSRYCIVKDLPPGASCDRFRHCVSDCLQCVQGVCKPVSSPLQQQQTLLEQQQELMLPLAVNGFSADQQQPQQQQLTSTSQHTHAVDARRLHQLQQASSNSTHPTVTNAGNQHDVNQSFLHFQRQLQNQQQQQHGPLDEATVRAAWEQRAAEASALLGEPVTAADLSLFFSVPRDKDGEPLETRKANPSDIDQHLQGQQAPWSYGNTGLAEQQLAPAAAAAGSQQRPLLNGSLAKRLARLFTGVSFAFSPEGNDRGFPTWGPPMHGFPSALPPHLPPHSPAGSTPAHIAGVSPAASAAAGAAGGGGSPQNLLLPTGLANALPGQEAEQQVAPQQLQQLQQLLLQQQQQGSSPFDSSLEAMEAAEAAKSPSPTGAVTQTEGTLAEEEGEPIQGLVFPGLGNPSLKPFSLAGKRPSGPLPPPLSTSPALNMRQPALPTRLPMGAPLAGAGAAVAPLPPLSAVPLGALGSTPALGPAGALGGGALPPLPLQPGLQPSLLGPASLATTGVPILGPLPGRFPTDYKGGCWIDRCCASHHYCSFLHASQGCQLRKREGAACVGDSERECEDRLSCINGQCSPWFTSRYASAGDPILLTDNVDLDSVCAPWQRFEYGAPGGTSVGGGSIGGPPQLALPSPLEAPNPYANNLGRDIVRTFRKFSGRCIELDKRSCVTDRECWGVGGFGFCDMRSRKCRTPPYPACLSVLRDLYSCLWHEGRLRESTEEYIVTQLPRMPQFLLHEAPVSINHVQSKCLPSLVRSKRAEFIKCVHDQGFTLERIVYVPEEWFQG